MQNTETLKFKSPDLVLLEKESKSKYECLKKEIARLKATNKIMRKLCTSSGFYKYFFSHLRSFETDKQCFDFVNQFYYDLFGQYRYTSYKCFKNKILKNGK
jgi:hypothetical protein